MLLPTTMPTPETMGRLEVIVDAILLGDESRSEASHDYLMISVYMRLNLFRLILALKIPNNSFYAFGFNSRLAGVTRLTVYRERHVAS